MQTVAVRTADLTGAALDWAVAKAIGELEFIVITNGSHSLIHMDGYTWSPSTDWSQCGPLINRFKVMVDHDFEEYSTSQEPCYAESNYYWAIGETELIAICRTIVKRHFGEAINVPAELVEAV